MMTSILEIIITVAPLLGSIAFMTLAERKIMGSKRKRGGRETQISRIGLRADI
jgi:NADH:ubiquinone oxidoreductase subunit H